MGFTSRNQNCENVLFCLSPQKRVNLQQRGEDSFPCCWALSCKYYAGQRDKNIFRKPISSFEKKKLLWRLANYQIYCVKVTKINIRTKADHNYHPRKKGSILLNTVMIFVTNIASSIRIQFLSFFMVLLRAPQYLPQIKQPLLWGSDRVLSFNPSATKYMWSRQVKIYRGSQNITRIVNALPCHSL